jgi:hypothetical protein
VTRTIAEDVTVAEVASPGTFALAFDSVAVTDAISTRVTRTLDDSVTLADAINTLVSRSISDSLAVTDTASAVGDYPLSDSVTLTDTVAMRVSRSIDDSVAVTDAPSTSLTRSASESLTVADEIRMSISRSVSDSVTVTDAITSIESRFMTETVTVTDTVAMSVTRSISDALAVADATAPTVTVTIAETLAVTDAVSTSASRAVADTATIDDSIAMRVSRSVEDSLAVTDAVTGSPRPALSDTVTLADAVSMSVTRSIEDSVTLEDAATPTTTGVLEESVAVTDTISTRVTRALAETILVTDIVSTGALAILSDSVSVSDAVSMHVTRSIDDSMTVADEAAKSVTVNVSDSVTAGDTVTPSPGYVIPVPETLTVTDSVVGTAGAARSANETSEVTDALTVSVQYFRTMEDSATLADALSINGAVAIPEPAIAINDAVSIHVTRTLGDDVAITEVATPNPGIFIFIDDGVAIADAIQVRVTRAIAEEITIIDEIGPPSPPPHIDNITITDAITNITVQWNRSFDEGLSLEDCGPYSCNHVIVLDEGLTLGGQFSDGTRISDTLGVTDSITTGPNKLSAIPPVQDSLSVSDSITGVILGILVVDDYESIGELPSSEVSGNYTYTGNATALISQIIDIPIPINSTTVRPNIPSDITILRTYHVPIAPTTEIPGDDVIVTEIHSEVPSKSNMFMRINFEETPALSEHDFLSTLDIEFTPAVNTTDFALVVSLMDGPPGTAPTPAEALRPIYIDVRWIGDFPGAEDPSVQEFYEPDRLPRFTFTVNDEWVEENSAEVDSAGVPFLKLWLLDEGTNQWEQITTIDRPSAGVDGTYTFVATLPHFSDYAITANVGSSTPGGGGGGGGGPGVPVQFAVNLLDALGFSESSTGQAIEIIEEPVGILYTANLLDSVTVTSRPVAYNTFQILKEVEVSITVVDVRQESAVPPSATAELETLIVNKGDVPEEFTLNFWYNDQTGERKFDLSLFVEVDAHSSKTIPVEIPFTEPGTFRVTAEARGVPGNELLESTQLTVVIPWLSVYLYVLIAVAVGILGGSGLAIALYMARNATLIAAGAGAAGAAIILAKKNKPRVRVAEWKEGAEDDDYDLLIDVTLANGAEGRLAPGELTGTFEFEITNKSRRKQEFVLAYHLEDVAGIRSPESAGIVKIDGHKEELRRDRITLPSRGAYVLWVEARTQKGEVLSKDRVAVRST